jgi:DNA-binding transcriptional LysR family regulator
MAQRRLQRNHLEAIVMVARLRSVHAASRALKKTQPAVSRLLTEAESLVGIKLFERSPQGTRPTASGLPLIDHAQSVLRSMERLGDAGRTAHRPIALGCIPRAMHTLMPTLLERLHDEGAFEVKVTEGSSASLGEALGDASLDFAITQRETPWTAADARFAFEALYDERTVVICARRNAAVPAAPVNLASLASLPWVLPAPETASRATFDRFARGQRLPPIAPVIEARSFESNLALVSGSRFLSIAPESIARRHASSGVLRIVKLRRELPPSRIMLVYNRMAREDPVMEAFRKIVIETSKAVRAALSAAR